MFCEATLNHSLTSLLDMIKLQDSSGALVSLGISPHADLDPKTRASHILASRTGFRNSVAYVSTGTEFVNNPVVRSDLLVSHFLDSVGGYRHKERRDRLLDILE